MVKATSLLGYVFFPEFTFLETTFQIFLCLFDIRKVGQWKTLSNQRKIWLGFQESVFMENELENNLLMFYFSQVY